MKKLMYVVIGLGIIIVILTIGYLSTILTQWAWNTLMPHLFKLPKIDFWQAFAFNLLALCFRTITINKK